MKKSLKILFYIITAGFLAVNCALPVIADDFEDFEESLATAARDYARAVRSGRNTRIAKDYEENLHKLQVLAAKIQKSIQTLGLGNDFDFQLLCTVMASAYSSEQTSTRTASAEDLRKMPPLMLMVKILIFDIKELKKLEFSSSDGGYYNPSFMEKLKLMEFDRTFNFCRANIKDQENLSNSVDYRKLYEKRLNRMKYLASEINDQLKKDNPAFAKKYNLAKEAVVISDCYTAFLAQYNKGSNQSSGGKTLAKLSSVMNNPDEEFRYSTGQISSAVNELYHSEYSTNPVEKAKADKDAEAAAALESRTSSSKKYDNDSPAELAKKLAEARERIYKSNNALVGIDGAVVSKYMTTLTDAQIKIFNDTVKKYTDRGYAEDRAKSSALLEIHANLKNGQLKTSDKDAAAILSKLDEN